MTGDHSAGLWTTVQPAASAGAIFQVDSMNGVFHGVITPTGPIGTRVEKFQCSSLGMFSPSRASAHLSAKKRKFSAARIAALAMKRMGLAGIDAFEHRDIVGAGFDGVGDLMQHGAAFVAGTSRQAGKAAAAACAARSMSAASPAATLPITLLSSGEKLVKCLPEWPAAGLPAMKWPRTPSRNRAR